MYKIVVRGVGSTIIEAHLLMKRAFSEGLEIIVVVIARSKSVVEIPIN